MKKQTRKSLSDFEDYTREAAHLAHLQQDLREAEAIHAEAVQAGGRNDGDLLAAEAAALAAGETFQPKENPDAARAHRRLRVLARAVAVQQKKVSELRHKHSLEICEGVRSEYESALLDAVEHFIAASKAFSRAQAIRGSLEAEGVAVGTLPVLATLFRVGDFANPGAAVHELVREAVADGLLPAGAHPAPVRGPYDDLGSQVISAVAAGPDGIENVTIAQGGTIVSRRRAA